MSSSAPRGGSHPGAVAAYIASLGGGGGRPRYSPLLGAAALLTALAVNLPVVYVFVRASGAGFDRFLAAIFSPLAVALLARTVGLVAGVVVLSVAIALPMAWLVLRTDLPGRRFWAIAGALPLVFPSYVSALALVAGLGPRGYVTAWIEAWTPLEVGDLIYGYSGALLALGLFIYPYVFLLLVAALRDLDPAYEECSRSLGMGRWRTFFSIVLPQLRPALWGGSLLVALYTLSDFGAVSITRFNTFTLGIYNAYRTLFDRSIAASLAVVLVALAVVLIGMEGWATSRLPPFRVRASRRADPVALGVWKWPALGFLAVLAAFNLVLPLGILVFWGRRALGTPGSFEAVVEPALGSVTVALAAAAVAGLLALPIALWVVRFPGRLSRTTDRLSRAGFALPGIVIALSLVFFVSRYLLPLYQTLTVLVAAYVIRFLPESLAATRAALAAVSPRFEEAARSLGSTQLGALRNLTLPMVRSGLLVGFGLVFLTAMKELPATLVLRPTGFETLATRIWSTAAEGIYSQAALPGLALVAISVLPTYLLVIRPVLKEPS